MSEMLYWLASWDGLLELPWWGYVVATIILTQISIASVTIYLHRHQAHRALDLHSIPSHFFRFWVWLTTAMLTPEWVAIHRKHHARVETEEDPHSPKQVGLSKVLLEGSELYAAAWKDRDMIKRYSHGTPDDWLEHHVYGAWRYGGVASMLLLDILFFGWIGITIWAVQMIWMPVFAAGTINGLGHWSGYRNFETKDASTNILPWGIFIGGEELHNNHHAFGSSAKLSVKPWELDIGWMYIRVLSALGLASVKKTVPVPVLNRSKQSIDMDTVNAVITNRLHVMADYAQRVMTPVFEQERRRASRKALRLFARMRRVLNRETVLLDEESRGRIQALLEQNHRLQVVYDFREELKSIWEKTAQNNDALLDSLQDWCLRAEKTGIEALEDFVICIRSYGFKPGVVAV